MAQEQRLPTLGTEPATAKWGGKGRAGPEGGRELLRVEKSEFERRPIKHFASPGREYRMGIRSWDGIGGLGVGGFCGSFGYFSINSGWTGSESI